MAALGLTDWWWLAGGGFGFGGFGLGLGFGFGHTFTVVLLHEIVHIEACISTQPLFSGHSQELSDGF